MSEVMKNEKTLFKGRHYWADDGGGCLCFSRATLYICGVGMVEWGYREALILNTEFLILNSKHMG
jgi:hypothetical protein